MPREAEPSLNEKQFLLQALKENLRLDGREFDHYRSLDLQFGDDLGVADLRLGKTRYVFALRAQLMNRKLTVNAESLRRRPPK